MQSFCELLWDPKVKAVLTVQGEKLCAINHIFSAQFQHLKWWNWRLLHAPLSKTVWYEIRCAWSHWSTRYSLPVHGSRDKQACQTNLQSLEVWYHKFRIATLVTHAKQSPDNFDILHLSINGRGHNMTLDMLKASIAEKWTSRTWSLQLIKSLAFHDQIQQVCTEMKAVLCIRIPEAPWAAQGRIRVQGSNLGNRPTCSANLALIKQCTHVCICFGRPLH